MNTRNRRRLGAGILAGLVAALGTAATAAPAPAPGAGVGAVSLSTRADPGAAGSSGAEPRGSEPGGTFTLPIDGEVLRHFDPPDQPWLAGHRGVDLAGVVGAEVRAAGAGTVAFAGVVVDRPVVSIDHPIGIRTTYEPVEPAVTGGEQVTPGQIIGVLHTGNGHCQVPCLHWGARIGAQTYIDPLALLRPPVIRLYPPQPW